MDLRKIKIIIGLFIIGFIGVKKQNESKTQFKISNEKYTNIIPISKGKSILEKNGEYFYEAISKIEKLTYTDIKKISENYILGKKEGKIFLVNLDRLGKNEINKEIIELPNFDEVIYISEERYILLKKDTKEFYYDLLEKKAVGKKYERLGEFSEGKALFMKDNKIGFINNLGEEIIENRFEAVGEFQNGFAIVITSPTGKYRYIDETGTVSVDEYDYIKSFKNGVLVLKKKNKNILMNNGKATEIEGEIVSLNEKYYLFKLEGINEIFNVTTNEIVECIEGKYLGITGNEVIVKGEKDYTIYNLVEERKNKIEREFEIELYRQDYFTGRKNDKVYIFDKKGKKLSKGFDIVYPKNAGVYLVGEENGYGVVGENGKEILKSQYDNIELMGEYITVEMEGKKSLFDKKGKKIIKGEYENIKYVKENIYLYDRDGWRYIQYN